MFHDFAFNTEFFLSLHEEFNNLSRIWSFCCQLMVWMLIFIILWCGRFILSIQQSLMIPGGNHLTRNFGWLENGVFCCARMSHRNSIVSLMLRLLRNRQSLLSLIISRELSWFNSTRGVHLDIVLPIISRARTKLFFIRKVLRIFSSLFAVECSSCSVFLRFETRSEHFNCSTESSAEEWTEITVRGWEDSESSLKPL